ncbi:hypothetical protein IFT69_18170 [Pseudomonas putida]|nr:hypothetical protein [Pseudomonas putida]
MKAFEVTLKGYYGGNDMTDDLILWVAAQSEESIYLAVGDCGEKIREVIHNSGASLEDCDWTLPADAAFVAMAVDERAIMYLDKEIVAIDNDRVIVWNEGIQDTVMLSYGPEAIAAHRLSEREKQLLIRYDIELSSLQGLKA